MEITDMMMKNLDSIIEHDNRLIGEQQMQFRVLQWAVAHKDQLSPLLRDGLIDCMEQEIERMKAERPKRMEAA